MPIGVNVKRAFDEPPNPHALKCPNCDAVMPRLSSRSEPEGLRKDAYCFVCDLQYMVTKSGCVKL